MCTKLNEHWKERKHFTILDLRVCFKNIKHAKKDIMLPMIFMTVSILYLILPSPSGLYLRYLTVNHVCVFV